MGMRYEYNIPDLRSSKSVEQLQPGHRPDRRGRHQRRSGADLGCRTIEISNRASVSPVNPSASIARTVIRGGYGIFYNTPALNNLNSGPQQSNAPFVSAQTFNSSLASPVLLSNPFPPAQRGAGA